MPTTAAKEVGRRRDAKHFFSGFGRCLARTTRTAGRALVSVRSAQRCRLWDGLVVVPFTVYFRGGVLAERREILRPCAV